MHALFMMAQHLLIWVHAVIQNLPCLLSYLRTTLMFQDRCLKQSWVKCWFHNVKCIKFHVVSSLVYFLQKLPLLERQTRR